MSAPGTVLADSSHWRFAPLSHLGWLPTIDAALRGLHCSRPLSTAQYPCLSPLPTLAGATAVGRFTHCCWFAPTRFHLVCAEDVCTHLDTPLPPRAICALTTFARPLPLRLPRRLSYWLLAGDLSDEKQRLRFNRPVEEPGQEAPINGSGCALPSRDGAAWLWRLKPTGMNTDETSTAGEPTTMSDQRCQG